MQPAALQQRLQVTHKPGLPQLEFILFLHPSVAMGEVHRDNARLNPSGPEGVDNGRADTGASTYSVGSSPVRSTIPRATAATRAATSGYGVLSFSRSR